MGAAVYLIGPSTFANATEPSIVQDEGVELIEGSCSDVLREQSGWQVSSCGQRWTSRYLVDASGKHGTTSESKDRRFSDRLVAVFSPWPVGLVRPWLSIEATRNGWWYVMPSAHSPPQAVFMTDFDLVPRDCGARTEWLHEHFLLAPSLQGLADELPNFSAHRVADARSSRARQFRSETLLLLGDAAWANDPLSGRGIALALDQAKQASLAICAGLQPGNHQEDPLAAYENWCENAYAAQERARAGVYAAASQRFVAERFWTRRCGT